MRIITEAVSLNPVHGEVYSIQHNVIKSVVFSVYSHFLHRYNWNIVESGVKHHNPNPNQKTEFVRENKIIASQIFIYNIPVCCYFLIIFAVDVIDSVID